MEEFFSSLYGVYLLHGAILLGNNRQDGSHHHLPPCDFLVLLTAVFASSAVPPTGTWFSFHLSVLVINKPSSVATVPSRASLSPEPPRDATAAPGRPSHPRFYGINACASRLDPTAITSDGRNAANGH